MQMLFKQRSTSISRRFNCHFPKWFFSIFNWIHLVHLASEYQQAKMRLKHQKNVRKIFKYFRLNRSTKRENNEFHFEKLNAILCVRKTVIILHFPSFFSFNLYLLVVHAINEAHCARRKIQFQFRATISSLDIYFIFAKTGWKTDQNL